MSIDKIVEAKETVHGYGHAFNEERKQLGLILIPDHFVETENRSPSKGKVASWEPPKKILRTLPRYSRKKIEIGLYHYEEDLFFSGKTYLSANNEGPWYPPDTLSEKLRIKYNYKTQKFRCSLDSSTDPKDPQKSTFGSISVSEAKKLLKSWKVPVDWE